jgi:RecB family exonuclease
MIRNSPSSINVYNQCPRLYYYEYIDKRPSFPHVDLIKGSIVHEALKTFFDEAPFPTDSNPVQWVETRLRKSFIKVWDSKAVQFQKLQLDENNEKVHYRECMEMLENWSRYFIVKLQKTGEPLYDAFNRVIPTVEKEVTYADYGIIGYIDSIEHTDGETWIIDYKTSSKFEITREHRLQLAVYALMFKKNFDITPNKAGVFFLRERLHLISVDTQMLDFAEKECQKIFEKTQSKNIEDYPQNTGYLCRSLAEACPCRKYEVKEL